VFIRDVSWEATEDVSWKTIELRRTMANLLQQLQNNEAVLLMYLADELPVEDRAEVEQMLASDASFRAELEEVRRAMLATDEALARFDKVSRLPMKQETALRHVSRMMNRWQVEKLARAPAPAPKKGLRYPWWTYPLATAASVLLAFLVYWGNNDQLPGSPRGEYVINDPVNEPTTPLFSGDAGESPVTFEDLQDGELADQLVRSFDTSAVLLDAPGGATNLATVERELLALAIASDDLFGFDNADVQP